MHCIDYEKELWDCLGKYIEMMLLAFHGSLFYTYLNFKFCLNKQSKDLNPLNNA